MQRYGNFPLDLLAVDTTSTTSNVCQRAPLVTQETQLVSHKSYVTCKERDLINELVTKIESLSFDNHTKGNYLLIPTEIRVYILSFLDSKVRKIMRSVSKAMRKDWIEFCKHNPYEISRLIRIAKGSLSSIPKQLYENLQKSMSCSKLRVNLRGLNISDDQIKDIIIQCPNIRFLRIWGNKITDVGIREIGKLTQLEHLHINSCKNITKSAYIGLPEKIPHLQTLDIKASGFSGENLKEFSKCTQLKTVFSDASEIDDEVLSEFFKGVQNLESIQLSGVKIAQSTIKNLSKHRFKAFNVSDSNLNDDCFISKESFHDVEDLRIPDSKVSDSIFEALNCSSKLRTLDISGCSLITGSSFKTFKEKYPKLETLEIGSEALTDNSIMEILSCSTIKSLTIKESIDITDKAFENLHQKLPHLKSLTLLNLHLTDEVFKHILECSNLEYLDFTGCGRIHGDGLVDLSTKLPNIKCLHAFNSGLNGNSLAHIFKCVNLEVLDLENILDPSDDDFKGIVHLQNLKRLHLGSTRVGRVGMAEIIQLKKLRLLDLNACRNLEDGFFEGISQLINLEFINLVEASVTQLITVYFEKCPKIRTLTF